MNILGFVFSLLLILSYSFYACWEKQSASMRLQRIYVGHQKATRDIWNRYQSEIYKQCCPPEKNQKTSKTNPISRKKKTLVEKKKKPDPNRECARINLWPLIQEGKESHFLLYELTAKMIRTFYAPLIESEKKSETRFLDALLAAAKLALQQEEKIPFSLEKINLQHPDLQKIYYKMLKGTKQWDLPLHQGYPPLLDYVKVVKSKEPICVSHAHPDMMSVLFGPNAAYALYEEIHWKKGTFLTEQLVEQICRKTHEGTLDHRLFALLQLGRPRHDDEKKIFVAEDQETNVTLRKNISLHSSQRTK